MCSLCLITLEEGLFWLTAYSLCLVGYPCPRIWEFGYDDERADHSGWKNNRVRGCPWYVHPRVSSPTCILQVPDHNVLNSIILPPPQQAPSPVTTANTKRDTRHQPTPSLPSSPGRVVSPSVPNSTIRPTLTSSQKPWRRAVWRLSTRTM